MFTRGGVAVMAAGLVLVVGGCGAGTQEKADTPEERSAAPALSRPPSKELVTWVGGICASTVAIEELRADSAVELKEIRGADEGDLSARGLAISYVSGTPTAVEDVERDLRGLGTSGVPAADRHRAAWLKKLGAVVPQLSAMSPGAAFGDPEGSAADIDELVQSLTPPTPELPALTEKDPRLAAAYESAEQCAPGWKPPEESGSAGSSGPLPEAADGTNTDACAAGACEILVASTADITANGVNVHISVREESVTFQSGGTLMQLGGAGGEARFGSRLKATVVAHNKDGAVLRFSNP